MKTSIVLFVVLVAVVASVYASPSKGSTKPSLKKKACTKDCATIEYKPVCGGDGTGKGNKSFGNTCVLENFNCENGQSSNWFVKSI
ncbi:hypothetical protein JTB14_025374 [Gonioctena quinquepunctata]|nr:hypothetical protein JTB14_025374 [Gonioctena quinquepunctata]